MSTQKAYSDALVVCEHGDDYHTDSGCFALGSYNVMGVTDWGPEPFEEPICACEKHLEGKPPYHVRSWRSNHEYDANASQKRRSGG